MRRLPLTRCRPLAGPEASSLHPADACPGGEVLAVRCDARFEGGLRDAIPQGRAEVLAVRCDARFESGPSGPPPVDGSRPAH